MNYIPPCSGLRPKSETLSSRHVPVHALRESCDSQPHLGIDTITVKPSEAYPSYYINELII